MNGLFIFDQAIAQGTDGKIYDAIFTDSVFNRYLEHVDQLTILVRLRPADMKLIAERKIPPIDTKKIRVVDVPNLLSIKGLLQYKKAREIVHNEIDQSDIIFIREPSVLESMASNYARKRQKKYILEVGGCPWDTFWNQGIKGKLIAPIRYRSTKRTTENAKYVVYVTNKWLQKRYPTNGKYVCCSNVNIQCNEKNLKKRLDKIEQGKKNNQKQFIIGSIGDYDVRSKGHRYVIMSLAKLNNKNTGLTYRYQIVGSGDNSESVKIAKKYNVLEYIDFLKPMNHKDILQWLDSIDIYAQPSKQEGLPRSVIEAMSRGTSVIGANTGGIPELIGNDCVFSNGKQEVSEIVKIISELNFERMRELAYENFKNAQQYNSEIINERRREFFKEIIYSE